MNMNDLSNPVIVERMLKGMFQEETDPLSYAEPMIRHDAVGAAMAPQDWKSLAGRIPRELRSMDPSVMGALFNQPQESMEMRRLLSDMFSVEEQRMSTMGSNQSALGVGSKDDYYFLQDKQRGSSYQQQVPYDAAIIRQDFPILNQTVNGKPLIWLDNAATTQKPKAVIDTISHHYEHNNSNVHRGAHTLAARSTDAYEVAREKTARFLGASKEEIVFVRGATEAINLVAQTYGRQRVGPGNDVLVSTLEHHSNIVPWQMLCTEKGANLRAIPVDDNGEIILEAYESMLGPNTRLVALTQVSNAIGTVLPLEAMIRMAHRHGICVLVDGAQGAPHAPVQVKALDCEFYVFSGHKVYGPTGIGVLYGKRELLEQMPPWQGGGNMIEDVTFERSTFQPAPMRFEAGTGNIADAIGLGAAIDYVSRIGMPTIAAYETSLLTYMVSGLQEIRGVQLVGAPAHRAGVVSFTVDGMKSEQVGALLAGEGIAVRSGHHCAQPALRRFGLENSVRPSVGLYNSFADIERMLEVVRGTTR